ncbi:MAG: hypothetical protein ABI193_26660 [Minicystis sp.]
MTATIDRIPAVPLAFALGTAACSLSLGLLPVLLEIDGAPSFQRVDLLVLGSVALVVASVQGFAWALGLDFARGLRRALSLLLLSMFALGSGLLKLAILGFALQETRRPSLVPRWGSWLAAGCDLLLLLSFASVLGAHDRARRGDAPEDAPRHAAWSWLVLIAALGTLIAPYLGLRLGAAAILLFAGWSWQHAVPKEARTRTFLNVPSAVILAIGLALAGVRIHEHLELSSPALLGVYALPTAQHCWVRPAEDFVVEGGSLWSIECSAGQRRLIGWDEAGRRAIEGEELSARRRTR